MSNPRSKLKRVFLKLVEWLGVVAVTIPFTLNGAEYVGHVSASPDGGSVVIDRTPR